MPQFVLLWHETPASFQRDSHWDLMLEAGDHLRCWAFAELPDEQTRYADALADHRLAYLDYEGPVSGDRGHVTRHDAGSFLWLSDGEEELIVRLQGARLRGKLTLRREPQSHQRWTVSFVPE